ncbi:hypothetical protein SEPCBS119000_000401 [Sporothrix epigloea]|uniref:Gluconokinase n=1 Tax=Sporothrix epigloea TaxID=1892477 RepID=A0ABP0D4X3_9PEZI
MLSSYTAPVAVGPASPTQVETTTTSSSSRASNCHHIWLVTGPAGCGKSTVAQHLADSLGLAYIEGDEFHPPANIEKMRNGIPLTDADRWDWLTALREESVRRIASGSHAVVLTCSALKRKYRDVIRVAPYFNTGVDLHFIYLSADPEILLKRVTGRQGHYMGSNMVQSQLDILEPPQADETDVVCIDVGHPIDQVKNAVLQKVQSITDQEEA